MRAGVHAPTAATTMSARNSSLLSISIPTTREPRSRSRVTRAFSRNSTPVARASSVRLLEHPAALHPAGARIQVAVGVMVLRPGREPRPPTVGVQPFENVARPLEQPIALVFEAARRHRFSREQEEAVLVIERRPPPPVPRVPAVERGIGHRDVDGVGAIVGPHDLADVGGGSERTWGWTGIEESNLPPAAMQLERRRDAKDPAADDKAGTCHGRINFTAVGRGAVRPEERATQARTNSSTRLMMVPLALPRKRTWRTALINTNTRRLFALGSTGLRKKLAASAR